MEHSAPLEVAQRSGTRPRRSITGTPRKWYADESAEREEAEAAMRTVKRKHNPSMPHTQPDREPTPPAAPSNVGVDTSAMQAAPATAAVERLHVIVAPRHGVPVKFKIKPTTRFQKMFERFRQERGYAEARFMFNGAVLHQDSCARAMGIRDGAIIDCVEVTESKESQHNEPKALVTPATAVDEGKILVHVKSPHGDVITFKLCATTPLKKVFDRYCDRKACARVYFMLHGKFLDVAQSAGQAGLRNDDTVDCVELTL